MGLRLNMMKRKVWYPLVNDTIRVKGVRFWSMERFNSKVNLPSGTSAKRSKILQNINGYKIKMHAISLEHQCVYNSLF